MTLWKVRSSLPRELDDLVETTIGVCIAVHRELGPGMNEGVYVRALQIEFEARGVSYECEKPVPIRYLGRPIRTQRVDLVVDGRLVLEAKSVERLHPVHVAQAVSYLRAMSLRVALVINFNVVVLKQGIRRVVL